MNRFRGSMIAVMSIFAVAAFSPAQADGEIDAMIDELRGQIDDQRRMIVEANLILTSDQKEDFWKTFDEYHADRSELMDERVAILTDYRDNYIGMTNEKSEDILKESIKLQKDIVDLKDKYRSKFVKVLLPRGALRYYQIENKIDATVNYDIASIVPLQPK